MEEEVEVKNIYNPPSLTSSSKTGAHFVCDEKRQSAENTGDKGIIHEPLGRRREWDLDMK